MTESLPVLDMSRCERGPREHSNFLADLRRAAREVGFFYVTGHGIEPAFLHEIMTITRRFFALPEEQKRAIDMVNSPHFRGYNRAGAELTRGQPDWREQIDIGAERTRLPLQPDAPPWARLRGPNQWPSALPELKPIILRWQTEASALLIRLLQYFALALGHTADVFEPLYRDEPHLLVKLIRYPGRAAASGNQGVGAHKDSDLLALLLQDEVGGLQVQDGTGWVDVKPLEGAFVVNIGELLELASNGYLRATVHRVVSPPTGCERLSVAFFLSARLDAVVPVLALPPDLAADAHGPESDPENPLLREVGKNTLKGRVRSHPEVAQRHHPDLLVLPELAR